jgi:hypothetical protein
MTRPVGKRKQKTVAHAPLVEVARGGAVLSRGTRFDMDVVFAKPLQVSVDVVFAKPLQVSVAMRTSYAAELLRKLRCAKKPRRGECHQISVDCPVEIVVDSASLKEMIAKLEVEVGGEV